MFLKVTRKPPTLFLQTTSAERGPDLGLFGVRNLTSPTTWYGFLLNWNVPIGTETSTLYAKLLSTTLFRE